MAKYMSLVPFELAKMLRDAGYPHNKGHHWYDEKGRFIRHLPMDDEINAPYFAEVFDWFLERNLSIEIYAAVHITKGFVYGANIVGFEGDGECSISQWDTWKEAAVDGVKIALMYLK